MAQTTIIIDHNEVEADMGRDILGLSTDRPSCGLKLKDYFGKVASGMRSHRVRVGVNAAKATGTFTLNTVIATDAVVINGTTFTCVASGATGNQFDVGADDTETAANLVTAINASGDVENIVTATSAAAVVTISAAFPGYLGNAITIVSNDATITASGARLTGGDNGALTRDLYFGSAV